jgi:hypothetical protein
MHVEALNHALANIPAEQLRIHLCWGNYEGPHHCDVPLADIIDIVILASPPGATPVTGPMAAPGSADDLGLTRHTRVRSGNPGGTGFERSNQGGDAACRPHRGPTRDIDVHRDGRERPVPRPEYALDPRRWSVCVVIDTDMDGVIR